MCKNQSNYISQEVKIVKIIPIFTFLWLILMLILSHIPGGPSAEESRWLSSMTGVSESSLRMLMHVVLYLVLGVLVVLAWPDTPVWMKSLALAITAVVDERSKALPFFPGRHCSVVPDMLLNLLGAGVWVLIGVLVG